MRTARSFSSTSWRNEYNKAPSWRSVRWLWGDGGEAGGDAQGARGGWAGARGHLRLMSPTWSIPDDQLDQHASWARDTLRRGGRSRVRQGELG